MITKLTIEGLRGIREGELTDLAPLTILVGPSGSGKSTILDALWIAASPSALAAIGPVVERHAELLDGAAWLFHRRREEANVEAQDAGHTYRVELVHEAPTPADVGQFGAATVIRSQQAESVINSWSDIEAGRSLFDATGARVNVFGGSHRARTRAHAIRLIEPQAGANHAPLHKLFGEAKQRGQHIGIRETLQDVVLGALDLSINTVTSGDRDLPYVEIEYADHTVPVAAAGSGIYGLLRLIIELSVQPGGLALVEEPEVHQHPAAIHQSAKALLVAMRRGVQVVVSTHSLDLIDSLLAQATPEDLEKFAVFRVVTRDGVLLKSRFPGPMVAMARQEIDEDLR